jgi:hypothetical protein
MPTVWGEKPRVMGIMGLGPCSPTYAFNSQIAPLCNGAPEAEGPVFSTPQRRLWPKASRI